MPAMAEDFATVPVLEAVPGLAHGFGRRARGPAPEARDATVRRVASALQARGTLQLLHQVHGAMVADAPWQGLPEADAGVATRGGPPWASRPPTACRCCWWTRGAASRPRPTPAGAEPLQASRERPFARYWRAAPAPPTSSPRSAPASALAATKSGDELRAAFGKGGEAFFRPGPRGKPHLDVRAANVSQLLDEGLPGRLDLPPRRMHLLPPGPLPLVQTRRPRQRPHDQLRRLHELAAATPGGADDIGRSSSRRAMRTRTRRRLVGSARRERVAAMSAGPRARRQRPHPHPRLRIPQAVGSVSRRGFLGAAVGTAAGVGRSSTPRALRGPLCLFSKHLPRPRREGPRPRGEGPRLRRRRSHRAAGRARGPERAARTCRRSCRGARRGRSTCP